MSEKSIALIRWEESSLYKNTKFSLGSELPPFMLKHKAMRAVRVNQNSKAVGWKM